MHALANAIKSIMPESVYNTLRETLRSANAMRYGGNRYHCIFCNGNFSTMLPQGFDASAYKEHQVIGGGYRLNTKCPRCLSGDRERHLYMYLQKYQSHLFTQPSKLLHVAPEKNLHRVFTKTPSIDYLTVDLKSPRADLKMDITQLTLDNDTFDVLICNHVLEHIPDDEKAMSELFRVLKTGGFAILQVPISWTLDATIEDLTISDPDEMYRRFGQIDHVRIYGPDYIKRLERVGFKVEVIDFISELQPEETARYALYPEEKIFVCHKSN
jgi:SAM-dependent methyltransferase